VSGFLKMLPAVIEFGASAEGAPVLAAMRALPDVLAYRGKLPAPLIPGRLIDAGVVNGPLHRHRPRLRRGHHAPARWPPHRARRGHRDVRADLQDLAHPQLHRHRRDLPARHQGHPQPAGRPPRPDPEDLPREEKKGGLYHRYERGLENQLGSLGLVLNCVVLWTTVYLDAAVRQFRAQGYPVLDEDLARLSPFVSSHLGVHGTYSFVLPDLAPGAIRQLRDPDAADEDNEYRRVGRRAAR
jgi:hypothetical protein